MCLTDGRANPQGGWQGLPRNQVGRGLEFKSKISSSIGMEISTLNSNKSTSSYDQNSADLIRWPLLEKPYFHSHESQFTKHLSFMNLEGDTLFQIQKWWDAIFSNFCQYLSTHKSWPAYKSLRAEHHNIYKFLLPPDTHTKYPTAKESYEAS